MQPLTEEELKLAEDEAQADADDDKRESLGAMSDGELRERKLLLQKKLQGLEEKERHQDKATPEHDSDNNGLDEDDEVASDAEEEEEQALRKAAQDSMKAKLAKKEELARRLSKEEEPDKKKSRRERSERDDESPRPTKKSRDGENSFI